MFLSPHCPYVKHIAPGLAALANEYSGTDLDMVAISSNDADQYPEDAPDGLRLMARELGFWFPYCYDETQQVAKRTRPPARPTFSCLTRAASWSIVASLTVHGRRTTYR
jgi:thiol-disulfide isomerase/thioredoxin